MENRLRRQSMFRSLFAFATVILVAASAFASNSKTAGLARTAVSADSAAAKTAINELRSNGQKGLNAILSVYAEEIKQYSATGEQTPEWKRIANAIDSVAMQKDAFASALYWFTDFEAAREAANAKNRPILSLRLLGNLNEEYSCANSRLFRSILYANTDISKYLRENYILHWQSVRPAPRITIDFGDGRKIERTITGNSIHYILDETGAIIDALPGLFSPKAFAIYLRQAREANKIVDGLPERQRDLALMRYRAASFRKLSERRNNVVRLANVELREPAVGTDAMTAAPRAMAKMMVVDEVSMLRVYDSFAKYEPQLDLSAWQKMSRFYSPENDLDAASIAFIRRQNLNSGLGEGEFAGMLKRLNEFIALDTTRNDFLYRTQIYDWLNQALSNDLEAFNARVYADVFMTPNSDKWLGLYSSDVYTAIDGNGVTH